MQPIRLNQVTDLHLGATEDDVLGGVRTHDSFRAVLDEIRQQGRSGDLFLLTGDLAGDAQLAAYQSLNRALKSNQTHALWLPGNHDDPDVMRRGLSNYPWSRSRDLGAWALLMVDSSRRDTPAGHISNRELEEIGSALSELGGKHVLVAMHHVPIAVGSAWLDRQRIDNQHRLYDLLKSHGNVKLILTGHVHQEQNTMWGEFPIHCCPSSCVQFKHNSDDFALSDRPPGFRWIELFENGSYKTAVEYLPHFNQQPDANCVGY